MCYFKQFMFHGHSVNVTPQLLSYKMGEINLNALTS